MASLVIGSLIAAAAVACSATPNAGARAQESAQELNVNTRFGRMELAAEKVGAKDREEFAKRHKDWHGKVRIADIEMAGVRQTSETEAEVTVRVAWYRPDEQELRITLLKQKWQATKGDWLLVGEQRADGDLGLLGEPRPPPPKTAEPRKQAHFPTIRIGAADGD